jgi:hypothetical protein
MNDSASLNENDRARAERMRTAVLEQIPEARPLIADLVKTGLISGWRNVRHVGPPRNPEVGPPSKPEGIPADVFLANSAGVRAIDKG